MRAEDILLGLDYPAWMDAGACGRDADHFMAADVPTKARVCGGCPVRLDCLTHALEVDEDANVWGGHDFADRSFLARLWRRVDALTSGLLGRWSR